MNPNATVTAPPKTGDEPEAESPEQSADTDTSAEAGSEAEAKTAAEAEAEPAAAPAEAVEAVGAEERTGVVEQTAATGPASPPTPPPPVPEPRATADPDAEADRGKSKKPRKAVRGGRSAGGTKSLVVWQQGRVHYADDSVFVLDLDDAASADLDVHELVDRLTELREVLDSPGRSEAVSALVEIIQEKALS